MKQTIKIILAGFFSQMFVVYALMLIENPWLKIFAALLITLIALVIYLMRQVAK